MSMQGLIVTQRLALLLLHKLINNLTLEGFVGKYKTDNTGMVTSQQTVTVYGLNHRY